MKSVVRYSDAAKTAIEEHVRWWSENRSADEATRWLDTVEDVIDPSRFAEAAESGLDGRVFREAYVRPGRNGTHRVIFEVIGSTVFLLQIKHVRQDGLSRSDFVFDP
ncbi:MAG: hypothetical protein AAGJ97_06695 [Planctomycetota bacterium]